MDANVIRQEEGSRVFEMQILGCTWEIVEACQAEGVGTATWQVIR